MRKLMICVSILLLLVANSFASEAVKVFVGDINVLGTTTTDKAELRQVLQALIRSQVSEQGVLAVDSEKEADFIVKGTYVSFGGLNTIDMSLMSNDGHSIARVSKGFAGDKNFIESVQAVSSGLRKEITAVSTTHLFKQPVSTQGQNKTVVEPKRTSSVIIPKNTNNLSISDSVKLKLDGKYNQIRQTNMAGKAVLAAISERTLVMIDKEGRKITSKEWPVGTKLIYIDTYKNNNKEHLVINKVYLNEVSTDVYDLSDGLNTLAVNQPYFISIRQNNKMDTMYLQEQGDGPNQFFGPVYEAQLSGPKVVKLKKVELPRYANIFNFLHIKDKNNNDLVVLFNEDRYLVVYNEQFKKLWQSSEKYGGSELFYQVKGGVNYKVTSKEYTTFYIDQRLQQVSDDTILVPRNDGSLVVGDSRTFKKGMVFNFKWTGTELEELWHTKESQSYLADYYLDPKSDQLSQLFLVQREDIVNNDKPASLIQIQSIAQ